MADSAENKWNVLDWTKRDQYAFETKDLDVDLWRWEFLRRDTDYRRSWDNKSNDTEINAVNAAAYDLPDFIDPALRAVDLKDKPKFLRTMEGTQLHDLRCSIAKFFSAKEGHELDNEFFTSYFRSLLCDNERAVFAFDITKPLEPQIERAYVALENLQQNYKKSIEDQLARNGKKMPRRGMGGEIPEIWFRQIAPNLNHLRALDAKEADCSFEEIGRVIFYAEDYNLAGIRGHREYEYARLFWKMI